MRAQNIEEENDGRSKMSMKYLYKGIKQIISDTQAVCVKASVHSVTLTNIHVLLRKVRSSAE